MDKLQQLKEQIDTLTLEEHYQINEYIESSIKVKSNDFFVGASEQVEKCPHCESQQIIKWGNYRGQKRFLCKSCTKTFVPTTGSVFQHLKKTEKFIKYLHLMFSEGFDSTESMAKQTGVSQRTGFEWRHRLAIALREEAPELDGIIEVDDVWFRYSQKGRKGLAYSRVRGRSSHKGDNGFQAKVLMTKERGAATDMSLLKIGRISKSDIKRKLHGKFKKSAILVSDKHPSIASFAATEGVKHESFLAKEHAKNKDIHVQTVNYLAGAFDDVINHNLRGVSTKYLQNYATWFVVSDQYKNNNNKIEIIMKRCMSNDKGWDMYTNIEKLYKQFLLDHSKRTYRCPTKQNRKAQYWNLENAESGIYL